MEPTLFPMQDAHHAVEPASRVRLPRRQPLPVLRGAHVALRPLQVSDAASLVAFLTTPEVTRFISAPPDTRAGFERFIEATDYQHSAGKVVCFAVTTSTDDTAIGLVQMREIEPGFHSAEWGFALGSMFWGTGIFHEAAELVLEFAFEQLGVHRIEARSAVRNGRSCRALHKLGACPEGVLRKSLLCNGQYLDQVLYAIVDEDWRATRRQRELSILH